MQKYECIHRKRMTSEIRLNQWMCIYLKNNPAK